MTRSSRRGEALTCLRFPAWRLPLFSLSLLTSAATNGGKARWGRRLSENMAALEQNSLVELDRQAVRVIG